MSLTPKKTGRSALRKLTTALTKAGAANTPVTVPALAIRRILMMLDAAERSERSERTRAGKNFQAYQDLWTKYEADRQRAQDAAPTPDELLTPVQTDTRTVYETAQRIYQGAAGGTSARLNTTDPVSDAIRLLRAQYETTARAAVTDALRTAFHRITGRFPTTRTVDKGSLTPAQFTEQLRRIGALSEDERPDTTAPAPEGTA